jgi:20S proteasome subunit beta 2
MKLACDAILAGVFNDLGSGSNVDLCIIKRDGTRMLRNYLTPNKKPATYVLTV